MRSRGRKGSLVARNPFVFSADTGAVFAVLSLRGQDVACACLAPRQRASNDQPVTTVGFVFVAPSVRGRGVGLELMSRVSDVCQSLSAASVLWSSKHAFYERFGWVLQDHGVRFLLSLEDANGRLATDVRVTWSEMIDPDQFVAETESLFSPTLHRTKKTILSIPTFAESSRLWVGHSKGNMTAAAVVGESADGSAYLLDVHATLAELGDLRRLDRYRHGSFTINCPVSDLMVSEACNGGIRVARSPLAMWLYANSGFDAPYISWIDRL